MTPDFTTVNSIINSMVNNIKPNQESVKDDIGKYRQLLSSSKANWVSWDSYKPDTAIVKVEIHEYVSPDGPGWSVVAKITDNKVNYIRVIHVVGPENWREHDWVVFDDK